MLPLRTALWVTAAGIACGARPPAPVRLAVVISVDQMRADYLDRYDQVFSGGFRRFLDRGIVYTDAHQDHAATTTAVGHATIGTGVYPRRHGIVGNDFYDRAEGRTVYSAEDSTVRLVGVPEPNDRPAGDGRSPWRLAASTAVDWIKDHDPDSRAFSVAIKDRAGTLMGGKRADGAYWYDLQSGNMITSTFYRDTLPEWVQAFNAAGHFAAYQDSTWNKLLPDSAYGASREDAFPTEGNGRETTFPHALPAGPGFFTRIVMSGYSDPTVLEFARTLIEQENLGTDAVPDLLFIGASAADYVGHAYGPWSQEAEDYYLRLDRALGAFFDFLDRRIGADAWVAVLSADHGVLPLPEYLAEQGIDARRVTARELREGITSTLERARIDRPDPIGVASLTGGIVLRYDADAVSDTDVTAFREAFATRLRELDYVADAYTVDNLEASNLDVPFVDQYRKQRFPGRGPDIYIRPRENVLVGVGRTGTSHGSPYRYDTHVPIVFMGPGLQAQRVDRRIRTVDIAPSLSAFLGVEPPSDLDGTVLPEVTGR